MMLMQKFFGNTWETLGWILSKDPFCFNTIYIFEGRKYVAAKVAHEVCDMWIASFQDSAWVCKVTCKQWASVGLAQACEK